MSSLGYSWRQQTVAAVEAGRREVGAAEILGLACALGTAVCMLMSPDRTEMREIALPSGLSLHPDWVTGSVRGRPFQVRIDWGEAEPRAVGPADRIHEIPSQELTEMLEERRDATRVEREVREAEKLVRTAAEITVKATERAREAEARADRLLQLRADELERLRQRVADLEQDGRP